MNISVIKSENKFQFEFIANEHIGMPIYKVPSNYHYDYSDMFDGNCFTFSHVIEKEQIKLKKNDIKIGDEIFVYSVWHSYSWLVGKIKKFGSSEDSFYVDLGKNGVFIYFDHERGCWANGSFFNKNALKKVKISL